MRTLKNRFEIMFVCLCVLVFVSCGQQQPARDAQPSSEPSSELIAEHMGEHYEQVDAAQKAQKNDDTLGIRSSGGFCGRNDRIAGGRYL
jgi:hypothetical protein